ncbi:Protein of unknown function (DUF2971) [Nitrosomonas oligotropha]|uniref:DUF2971 domain-containing protein n=1 Tax=Nitrosomonas oligotropha TaxID=42354 RepID=A0A2T5HYP9_9PROT|nr:DUF2971 domain-containing protein [Nitrosomonas oligotropha]PTQ76697.1 Protein of unknown function (DUF2971) [Nitrosomonas oligotropha]
MHTDNLRILTYRDLFSAQDIDKFLSDLNQQPIHKRRKLLNSHGKIKPYPHFIYKYLPLESTNIDDHKRFLRDYLVESRLWLSSPSKFNDPFDMKCRYVFEGKIEDQRKYLQKIFKLRKPDIPQEQRGKIISDVLTGSQPISEALTESHNNQIDKIGVCCFSENTKNILMWSHYGSSHKGISLQFHISKDLFIFTYAVAVDYSYKYPAINYLNGDLSIALTETLKRKSKDWEYEEERRLIHPKGANSYLRFDPSALTALILGCKLESDSEEIIRLLLRERMQKNYPPLKIFRATQDNKEYKIRIKRISNFS